MSSEKRTTLMRFESEKSISENKKTKYIKQTPTA